MYKIWFARNYRTDVANTLLLDNALATMGAGLPSAMMAALLYPAASRAGGLRRRRLHDEQPGAGNRASRLKLNLVVLIIEDHAYGMIRWKQAVDGFADWGLTFDNPDFVAARRLLRARGRRVSDGIGSWPWRWGSIFRGRVALDHRPHRLQRKHQGACRRAQAHAGISLARLTSTCSCRTCSTSRNRPLLPHASWSARYRLRR